jgi:hypothetical protein
MGGSRALWATKWQTTTLQLPESLGGLTGSSQFAQGVQKWS